MEPAAARRRLERMTSADVDPVLDDAALDDLLEDHARADADGRRPTDPDWLGTWDLNSAAAAGWQLKADACAHRLPAAVDGARLELDKLRASCAEQAKLYRERAAGNLSQVDVVASPTLPRLGPNQVANL